jgi:hypothetical protein
MAFLLLPSGQMMAASAADEQSSPAPGNAAACATDTIGSPYIPVDSWIYPAVLRLYSLGYADSAYLGMRPWTRASLSHALEASADKLQSADAASPANDQAQAIYDTLLRELRTESTQPCDKRSTRLDSLYSATRAISGTSLRDSYHLGSTIVNDYGRPYENGLNEYSGASGYATAGRFVLYLRGELQAAPSATGYSTSLAEELSNLDGVTYLNKTTGMPYNQATIPLGPIASTADGRLMEAYASAEVLNHIISFGKQDEWLGPGQGGAMAYSNNAENIYAFRINRIEPLHVPGLSVLTGPFRYEFLVGSLKGHTQPNDPWVHVEKVSFKPTRDLEFGFERTVIWGGKGHEAINLKSFLRSFFSTVNVTGAVKFSNQDPGARFGAFDFTYRLPFARNWLTLYTDSEAHDDVSPVDAPRRAAYRPGLYLSHFPTLAKLDLRLEGASTDPPTTRSNFGQFNYYEAVQRQGYTNKGSIFGDWIGREDKGGQAWTTWHFTSNEWIQAGYRHQKAAKDFISGGTTLDDFSLQVVKRFRKDLELNGNFALEHWKAPLYLPGQQTVTTTSIQLTWFPTRKIAF